jgi:hypothetical protein
MLIKLYSWRNGVHSVSFKWYKIVKEWRLNCYFMDLHERKVEQLCKDYILCVCFALHCTPKGTA